MTAAEALCDPKGRLHACQRVRGNPDLTSGHRLAWHHAPVLGPDRELDLCGNDPDNTYQFIAADNSRTSIKIVNNVEGATS
jgi:hypothetical protein